MFAVFECATKIKNNKQETAFLMIKLVNWSKTSFDVRLLPVRDWKFQKLILKK